ncbi:MAG: hypothetical protein ACC608_08565 [Anaerofustis sp.]
MDSSTFYGLLTGSIIAIYILKRFDWFKPITLGLASIRYGTKNILLCSYRIGFNDKYKRSALCYLIANSNDIILHPHHHIGNDAVISYDKIIEFIIVRQEDSVPKNLPKGSIVTGEFPKKILYYVGSIIINFVADNGTEDRLEVSVGSVGKLSNEYFNDYSNSKFNFFERIAKNIPDRIRQEVYDSNKH